MLVNQLKQPPLGSKLHTNVQSTLFRVFSWMKCYAHSHHSLKHGNTGVHISIQDCSWLLLSPTKELRSPSFLLFSNLKENIHDSLWGQYLWAKLCCFLVFLGHVELGILKVILGRMYIPKWRYPICMSYHWHKTVCGKLKEEDSQKRKCSTWNSNTSVQHWKACI